MKRNQVKVVIIIGGIFLVLWFIFIFFPLYWMFNTAFKTTAEVHTIPPTFFPKSPTIVAFRTLVHNAIALKSLLDSMIISVTSTLLAVFFGSLAGYAFARWPRLPWPASPNGGRTPRSRRLGSRCRSACG